MLDRKRVVLGIVHILNAAFLMVAWKFVDLFDIFFLFCNDSLLFLWLFDNNRCSIFDLIFLLIYE
jgi:hypothetical protein